MARRCAYCEKRPVVGNKISHSNIKTKVRHLPNLQKMKAMVDGMVQRVYVCTRCLRSGRMVKPPKTFFLKKTAQAVPVETSQPAAS